MDSACIWALISPVFLSMVSCLFPSVREAAQAAATRATEECCSSVGSWVVGLCHLRTNAGTLKRERDELMGIKTRLLEDVERLERAGDVKRTPVVRSWLKDVDGLDAAVTEFESSYCCCCCPSPPRCFGCLCSACELDDMRRLVVELKKRKDELGELVCPLDPPAVVEIPGTSRDADTIFASRVDEILNVHLSSDEVEMVGIYGMGGVGKTELLRAVNNRLYRRSTDVRDTIPFEMVIYAEVNNSTREQGVQSSTPTVQEQIRRRLRLPASGDLSATLSSKRPCLLLLDDLWDTQIWDKVGIPRPSPTMKVVFTTPSKLVCDRMKAVSIRVDFLGDEEAWQLFCRKMGEVDRGSWSRCDGYVRDLARRVVSRCGGLPRAIVAIPWAVGVNFEGPQQWKRIENRLKDSPHELEGMVDVLSPLKCCLERLEKSPTQMEECLLYCSLFPESRNINREQLIDYWIGEGFLDAQGSLNIRKIRQRGSEVIDRLQKDCLLEPGHRRDEDEVKLHSVVRQLALWLTRGDANKKFFTSARMELPDISTDEGWEEAIRISLMGSSDKDLPDEIPECPRLETLLLNNHDHIDPRTKMQSSRARIYGRLDDLFRGFSKQLRVLDLSGTNMAHLPPTVGSLVGLTYLNISHTDVAALPVELRALVDLRQLNLSNTPHLGRIPHEAISPLTRLQALNLYCSAYEMSHEPRRYLDVGDGGNTRQERQLGLEDLGSFGLQELGISIKTKPALDGFLASRASLRHTTFLSLDEVSGLREDDVKSVFHGLPGLRRLSISGCPALNQLTFPARELQELKVLSLKNLPLSSIATEPAAGSAGDHFLPCLHDLQISLCHALSDLTCIRRFPHLVEISVTSCHGLRELIAATPTTSDVGRTTLPMLRGISLEDLTSFASFSGGHPLCLTHVERIRVSGCPNLKKLPLRSSNLNALKEIEGERTWWDNLGWDQGELDVLDDFRRRFKELPLTGQ